MIAATRSCGVTGLKACTSDARLTSDVLIVATVLALLARQLQRLPGGEQRGRQPVRLENRLHVRPGIAPVVGGGDAPHRIARRHHDTVGRLRATPIGEAAGGEEQGGRDDHDAPPAAAALGSRVSVSGTVLHEHVFVDDASTNKRSRQSLARTSVCNGRTDVLGCPRFGDSSGLIGRRLYAEISRYRPENFCATML